MRRLLHNVIAAAILLVGVSTAPGATILVGVFSGNVTDTPESLLEIQTLAADPSITLYSKSDNGSGPFAGSLMTITGVPGSSGTWTAVDPSVLISYFAVKASNEFALYRVVPEADSGPWTTSAIPYNRNPHEVSHLTFYLSDIPGDPTGVPEPSTFILLAGGGVAGWIYNRRRVRRTAEQ